MERYDSNFDHVGDFVDRWNAGVRRTRLWTIVLGVLLVVAGIGAAAAPYSIYATIQAVAAVVLIVCGVARMVGYARTPELFRSPTMLVTGVLNALLGLMLLALPAYLTAGTITFLLAFVLMVVGAERITSARRMRYFGVEGTGAATALGVVNVIAGAVFLLMPLFSGLVLGYLVAGYLVVAGVCLVVEGISMREIGR